jgi:hypothetical protein
MNSGWRLSETDPERPAELPDQIFAAAPVMCHTKFRVGMARVGVNKVVGRHWMDRHPLGRPTKMQKPWGSHRTRVNVISGTPDTSSDSVMRTMGPGPSANGERQQRRGTAFPRVSREFRSSCRHLREIRERQSAVLRRTVRVIETRVQLEHGNEQLRARLATIRGALVSSVSFSNELISLHMRAMSRMVRVLDGSVDRNQDQGRTRGGRGVRDLPPVRSGDVIDYTVPNNPVVYPGSSSGTFGTW